MLIAQFGYFDLENYGDLLFPDILRNEIRKRNLNIQVDLFSNNGGYTLMGSGMPVYSTEDLPKMHALRRYDAFVIGGGELIRFDMTLIASHEKYEKAKNTLIPWMYPILFAYANQIPVLFNCPGVPFPFNLEQIPEVKLLLNGVNYCSVRDAESKRFLEGCGVDIPIKVVPDTAFLANKLYSDEMLEDAFRNVSASYENLRSGEYVLFQFNGMDPSYSIEAYVEMIHYISETLKMQAILLPIGYVHEDLNCLKLIQENDTEHRIQLIEEKISVLQMTAVLANAGYFIGTSLHGNLISYLYNVPSIAIDRWHLTKIHGLFQWIGREGAIATNISEIPEKLTELMPGSMDNSRLSELQELVKTHFDLLFEELMHNSNCEKANFLEACVLALQKGQSELHTGMRLHFSSEDHLYSAEKSKEMIFEKTSSVVDLSYHTKFEEGDVRYIRFQFPFDEPIWIEHMEVCLNGVPVSPTVIEGVKLTNGYLLDGKHAVLEFHAEQRINDLKIDITAMCGNWSLGMSSLYQRMLELEQEAHRAKQRIKDGERELSIMQEEKDALSYLYRKEKGDRIQDEELKHNYHLLQEHAYRLQCMLDDERKNYESIIRSNSWKATKWLRSLRHLFDR